MARVWLNLRGIRKPIINLPLWGATIAAFRRGLNTAPHQAIGKITWAEWVARKYNIAPAKTVTATAS
jgi:hypothetical protein